MFRALEYQERVLTALEVYLDRLTVEKMAADEVAELLAERPKLKLSVPDFSEATWEGLRGEGKLPVSRSAIPYSPRRDGMGNSVPNTVLKVPTGGGKTYIAIDALARIFGKYFNQNTGFVLWIVPNEAIYTQTLKALKDRQHHYRQALDRAAAGKVLILEKNDVLNVRDVEANLCVMLLMLQSANRETKDTLKIFRDRGDVHGFTPAEGDQQAHAEALARTPNLDAYEDMFPMVKDSLGNALRIIRPVVVMDEGHRAISPLAVETLYGFNPSFVLELTATPKDVLAKGGKNPVAARPANVLVEVTGKELDREGMIKMPLNLDARQGVDWKATLNTALERLKSLAAAAVALRAETQRYIRPIMLVQVERTGKDQREGGHIHADDVRDWLMTVGLADEEIAIKTAEQNDLKQPEKQELMSPKNRVRVIITKQALQEGWDCPFAYVLCALAASSNKSAMTQLVGRILRQPDAMKTGVAALDEGYVVSHHAKTGDVVTAIKEGLERDGLGDLVLAVGGDDETGGEDGIPKRIERRATFQKTKIYLPKVLLVDKTGARDLDYETDILSMIDWRKFDPKTIADKIPENARAAQNQLQRIELVDKGDERIVSEIVAGGDEGFSFDAVHAVHAVRAISDLVPNPFVGREIVERLLARLKKRGFAAEKIGVLGGLIVEQLRLGLDKERNKRAEVLFKGEVEAGNIQFRLRADGNNWVMPDAMSRVVAKKERQLVGEDGGSLERSLFSPIYENDFNNDERDVAVYLDGDKALKWWHRNVARTQYGIQGWQREKIYPDFIFAVQSGSGPDRLLVLETKGDHLDNPDTAYKDKVLSLMTENFAWDSTASAGTLELIKDGETVECSLVLMSEVKAKLPGMIKSK